MRRLCLLVILIINAFSCYELSSETKEYNLNSILDEMINESLQIIKKENASIYTFAFYHDHETEAISICIDTEENSNKQITSSNDYSKKYFQENLKNGDMKSLQLWNFNTGRNFSLGDFSYVNIVYKKLDKRFITPDMYLNMIKSIERNKSKILTYSQSSKKVVFCCSSENNEVEYIWQ